ncbi:hypothetical protein J3L16_11600 [Alteromonas sp. 5E99-2]|uniref:hypothetical protein n=1 Tax=Alteromonas sp. 5E99-2 TaxID=2817683 RepID=UPI001A9933BA|nr:hypothetical protein [Alteromonas sp. 5E99-2]MBO1256326.1 hypothetical protein [Alteromonas sp. 5E99-2]
MRQALLFSLAILLGLSNAQSYAALDELNDTATCYLDNLSATELDVEDDNDDLGLVAFPSRFSKRYLYTPLSFIIFVSSEEFLQPHSRAPPVSLFS